jgi:hypothetical protein
MTVSPSNPVLRFFERDVDPAPAEEAAGFAALFDQGLVSAVDVLLSFDEEVEPAPRGAVGDVFVAFALAGGAQPRVLAGSGLEIAIEASHPLEVVEDDEEIAPLRHDAARFEDPLPPGRRDQLGERVFGDELEGGGHLEGTAGAGFQPSGDRSAKAFALRAARSVDQHETHL